MLSLCVLVSGGGTNLQTLIDAIEEGRVPNARIDLVISNNADAYALERAKQHHIPAEVISPKDFPDREAFHAALKQRLIESGADLIVLAGYLVAIPPEIVDAFPSRIINIHPSLIPSFCGKGFYGLHVHEAALKRGVKITGATVHYVDKGTDTGPIILQKAVEVDPADTPQTLQRRVMEQCEWVILPQAVSMIANEMSEEKKQ